MADDATPAQPVDPARDAAADPDGAQGRFKIEPPSAPSPTDVTKPNAEAVLHGVAAGKDAAGLGDGHGGKRHGKAGFIGLSVGSIGVVYGDIGTSPLYAFRSALAPVADRAREAEILGVVSLALWAMILVVTVKYVLFVMRADNKGEGGVLSLMALAQRALGKRTTLVFILGVMGAALFYGDSIITPAVSVLGAEDGLKTLPGIGPHVTDQLIMLISVVILFGLFLVQSRGTAKIGQFFGPVMLVWFLAISAMGILHIADSPRIFAAINPWWGVRLIATHGYVGFLVLGSVFLTVTGGEALYADMGHFGRWPIQAAWLFFVLPALALNYLGQGAFVLSALHHAHAAGRPLGDANWFYLMAPEHLRLPLALLATFASVIASQAVITGAFSLSQQAILLGLLPRMDVRRTSETHTGQIFLPQVNTLLLVGVLVLVVMFHTADNLAHAYGLAVTGTMLVTTVLAAIVARRMWGWKLWQVVALISPLVVLDATFLSANVLKIASGGWFPLLMGMGLFMLMSTWSRGSRILSDKTRRDSLPLGDLIEMLSARPPHRAPGTAIFLTSDPDLAPVALMHNLKHNKVLHEKNIVLTVKTAETPRVPESERVRIHPINEDFRKVVVSYGFMETPNVPKALGLCRKQGLKFDIMSTSFFLGRRSVVPSAQSGMPLWQDRIYIFLLKNSTNPTEFFKIPPGRVVELGAQVTV